MSEEKKIFDGMVKAMLNYSETTRVFLESLEVLLSLGRINEAREYLRQAVESSRNFSQSLSGVCGMTTR